MRLMYDLSAQSLRYRRLVRWARWFAIGATIFTAILALLSFLPLCFPVSGLQGSLTAGGFLTLICGLFAVTIWVAAPPADGFEMDGVGLHFTYRGRVVWLIDWANPKFWIFVDTTEGAKDLISQMRPVRAVAFGWRGFRAMLSPEAYDAMLAEFQRRGLVSERRPGIRVGYTRIRFYRPVPPTVGG